MPYRYEWYIEGQVVYLEIWGEQTMEELEHSNGDMLNHLNNSNGRKIHLIMNDEKLVKAPVGIAQLQKVLSYVHHPHLGWVVLIGDKNKSLKMAAEDLVIALLARLSHIPYVRYTTLDEALAYLRGMDETIDWNGVNPAFQTEAADSNPRSRRC